MVRSIAADACYPETCGGAGVANVCGCYASVPGCRPQLCGGQTMVFTQCLTPTCAGGQRGSPIVAADGTPCSDGNACNGLERCFGGTCVSGVAPIVDDGDSCTTDVCLSDGTVANTLNDGGSCGAGDCFLPPNGTTLETSTELAAAFIGVNSARLSTLKGNLQNACASCASVLP